MARIVGYHQTCRRKGVSRVYQKRWHIELAGDGAPFTSKSRDVEQISSTIKGSLLVVEGLRTPK